MHTLRAKKNDLMKETLKSLPTPRSGGSRGWHTGKITSIGYFSAPGSGGREVSIYWPDDHFSSRKQGDISDAQWEIFKLAFHSASGKITVISSRADWYFDFSLLEANRDI